MTDFRALRVKENNDQVELSIDTLTKNDLPEGDVLIKVAYSSLNYKDMLASQTKGGVIRHYPMTPGIDLSGTVEESNSDQFKKGDQVLVTGFGIGVSHPGGLAEYAKVPAEWVVHLPEGLNLESAMVFGTAGFTAALSVAALEEAGMKVTDNPAILVTGATGGVGSVALQILAKAGYQNITALIRKDYQVEVAKNLGAHNILDSKDLGDKKPLGRSQFDYILDTVGGDVAATLLGQLSYDGAMSMCGNAAGIKFEATVFPMILRGNKILGIDSVQVPIEKRPALWNKMAGDWNVTDTTLYDVISLDQVPATIQKLKEGSHLGRTIVKM